LRRAGLEAYRRRNPHRNRRLRRACLGELVHMDASEHDCLADVSAAAKMRTFLLLPDITAGKSLQAVLGADTFNPSGRS
jgi:hypothetical protein